MTLPVMVRRAISIAGRSKRTRWVLFSFLLTDINSPLVFRDGSDEWRWRFSLVGNLISGLADFKTAWRAAGGGEE
jgi:hypothetical protein